MNHICSKRVQRLLVSATLRTRPVSVDCPQVEDTHGSHKHITTVKHTGELCHGFVHVLSAETKFCSTKGSRWRQWGKEDDVSIHVEARRVVPKEYRADQAALHAQRTTMITVGRHRLLCATVVFQ